MEILSIPKWISINIYITEYQDKGLLKTPVSVPSPSLLCCSCSSLATLMSSYWLTTLLFSFGFSWKLLLLSSCSNLTCLLSCFPLTTLLSRSCSFLTTRLPGNWSPVTRLLSTHLPPRHLGDRVRWWCVCVWVEGGFVMFTNHIVCNASQRSFFTQLPIDPIDEQSVIKLCIRQTINIISIHGTLNIKPYQGSSTNIFMFFFPLLTLKISLFNLSAKLRYGEKGFNLGTNSMCDCF